MLLLFSMNSDWLHFSIPFLLALSLHTHPLFQLLSLVLNSRVEEQLADYVGGIVFVFSFSSLGFLKIRLEVFADRSKERRGEIFNYLGVGKGSKRKKEKHRWPCCLSSSGLLFVLS